MSTRPLAQDPNASGGLAMVQTLLGHSSADVTMRYIDPKQTPKNNQADSADQRPEWPSRCKSKPFTRDRFNNTFQRDGSRLFIKENVMRFRTDRTPSLAILIRMIIPRRSRSSPPPSTVPWIPDWIARAARLVQPLTNGRSVFVRIPSCLGTPALLLQQRQA